MPMKMKGALKALGALLLVCLIPFRLAAEPRRLSVVIFPTENSTGLEVWESKYYPYNVLERKMSDYLEALFKRSPLVEARVLDVNGMNRWLSGPRKPDDMAVQMELFEATLKERLVMGKVETGRVNLRLRLFDAARAEQFATRMASGADRRYTFEGSENLYWINAAFVTLPFPFKNGLDLFGLTAGRDRGQKMSRVTWAQFQNTSHWQSIKNAINEAHHQAMGQVSNAIRRNEPNAAAEGRDTFSPSFSTVGRIISPTANSKRRRREYIISLGRQDSIQVGDLLDVVRSDTYVTVDPEHPVVVLPKTIGKVKVVSVQEKNAVVRVVKDNRKEPIQLKDIVIKVTGPRS